MNLRFTTMPTTLRIFALSALLFGFLAPPVSSTGHAQTETSSVPSGCVDQPATCGEIDATPIEDVGSPTGEDWTAVFSAAALTGKIYQLRENTTYTLTSQVEVTVGGFGLIGPRSARVYLPAAHWGDTEVKTVFGKHKAVFFVHGSQTDANAPIEGLTLRGFTIESEVLAGRTMTAVAVRNVRNIAISDLEIFGLPGAAIGIGASTITGRIVDNYIHDFLEENAVFSAQPQGTAIEIDNHRVAAVNSTDLVIANNRIHDILMTGEAASTYGTQTDGINLQGLGPAHIEVSGNVIAGVGEGIDIFSHNVAVTGNMIDRATDHGIKLIHGASHNRIVGGSITNTGRGGILISGNGWGEGAIGNSISEVMIVGVNFDQSKTGGYNTAGVRIVNGVENAALDTSVLNCYIDPGAYGDYAIWDSGDRSILTDNRLAAGAAGLIGGE